MPTNNPLISALAKYRREMDALDAQALERIFNAYQSAFNRIKPMVEALTEKAAGLGVLTEAQMYRLDRYKALQAQIESELAKFSAFLDVEIDQSTRANLLLGEEHALGLMRLVSGGREFLRVEFDKLPKPAVETLLGFLSPDSPLQKRINELAPYHADKIGQELVNAIIQGWNPYKTSREIAPLLEMSRKALEQSMGNALSDALRMARTAQLWTYREASRANYIANSDVLSGWIWYAELDADVCMSCVAQHGTFHTFDETLDDHYNGRCAMIPVVSGIEPPNIEAGAAWFAKQPEATQRAMMGGEKHAAWQAGKFEFPALSKQKPDPTYGTMHFEASLKDLIGDANE